MRIFISILLSILGIVQIHAQTKIEGSLSHLSQLTLERSPLIQRNALTLGQAAAQYRSQRSAFDYQLGSEAGISKNKLTLFDADPRSQILSDNLETGNTGITAGLSKRFRTGTVASINSEYSATSDNFTFDRFGQEVGPDIPDHVTSATFSLTQPLLRGNSKKVVTALEESAKLDMDSAEQRFELSTAYELLQFGNAYWQYVLTHKSLEVFQQNQDRVASVLQMTEELVKADKKPASDLIQVKADLAEQERQTKLAEQTLFNAKINLGRVIGLNENESLLIDIPTDDFPTVLASGFSERDMMAEMVIMAREHRSDLQALDNTTKGLELQLTAAKNSLLPQLDLTGYLGIGGENFGGGLEQFYSAYGNDQGKNSTLGVGMKFVFPLNNNQAKANHENAQLALTDQQLALENQIRNISLNVNNAVNFLENSVSVLEKALETLEYYQEVFSNERVKFQNGMTTMLNLIIFQERLTYAQLEYLRAKQQFANAIVNLRFETGTLVKSTPENGLVPVGRSVFYTIPNNDNL
ncbi:MAG: TolC family protein [Flavobacteriaceae bacterium]